MTHLNDTMLTNLLATHRKYAHLTKEERVMIATLKSQSSHVLLGIHFLVWIEIPCQIFLYAVCKIKLEK